MRRKPLTIEEVLTRLAEAPPRIATLTAELTPAQLRTVPSPDEWSANDVLAHLRACADVWGKCIAVILAEDSPTYPGMDPRTWMEKTDYPGLEFRRSFRFFATQRADLLAVLEALPPEGWSRTATVTAWGQLYEQSVLYYAQRMAQHERTHLRQIQLTANSLRVAPQPGAWLLRSSNDCLSPKAGRRDERERSSS